MVKEMNIYDIKNKANEVLRQPNQLFKVYMLVLFKLYFRLYQDYLMAF